jgi:hypothetical protein
MSEKISETAPLTTTLSWAWLKAHPLHSIGIVLCWVACLTLALTLMPQDAPESKKWIMGFCGGLFTSLCLICGRMFKA